MNKIVSIIALLVLTAVSSFSQENTFQFGVRTGFSLYDVYWRGKPPGMGMGFGGGIITSIPIANSLTFNPELNFFYRNLYNHELAKKDAELSSLMPAELPIPPQVGAMKMDATIKESLTEFAIGIPLMLRFTPTQASFYLTGGVQFSIPFSSKLEQEMILSNEQAQQMMEPMGGPAAKKTIDYKDRATVDIGAAFGVGYYMTQNFAVDLRGVYDLTNISAKENDRHPPYNPFRKDKTWLLQYCLGLSYFF
ncbi:MAG: PorT family protein [Fibromonadaceae bacterium]|jgi:hypothetical protein|nr:PorT family protein [Fibromonadaceae bacterium]